MILYVPRHKSNMPLHIDDDASTWHRDFAAEDLIVAIRRYGLPTCLERTVVGDVPDPLRYWCESVSPNAVWPLQSDFIPLWTTNGTSCLAYEPSINKFTYQHIEDVPTGATRIFDSFLHVCVWVLLDLIGGDTDDEIRQAIQRF